jgi:hypothetical protein
MSASHYQGVGGHVGKTPLIQLQRLSESTDCEILGKAACLNPGASGDLHFDLFRLIGTAGLDDAAWLNGATTSVCVLT